MLLWKKKIINMSYLNDYRLVINTWEKKNTMHKTLPTTVLWTHTYKSTHIPPVLRNTHTHTHTHAHTHLIHTHTHMCTCMTVHTHTHTHTHTHIHTHTHTHTHTQPQYLSPLKTPMLTSYHENCIIYDKKCILVCCMLQIKTYRTVIWAANISTTLTSKLPSMWS